MKDPNLSRAADLATEVFDLLQVLKIEGSDMPDTDAKSLREIRGIAKRLAGKLKCVAGYITTRKGA